MPKKLERGIKGKYPQLPEQELGIVRLFFYVNLLLLVCAVSVLLLDLFDFFKTSYAPHSFSFIGIFILILIFLRAGKKIAALNALMLIPIPAYYLFISSRYAIFPPESSFSYEIYLFTSVFIIYLLLSEKPLQIFTYLIVTTGVLLIHTIIFADNNLLYQLNWNQTHTVHPLVIYLMIGIAGFLLYLISHLRLKAAILKNQLLQENQSRVFQQYFEGILKLKTVRDEFGEKTGYKIIDVNAAFEEFFEVRNSEVREMPAHLLFQKLFRGEVDWQSLIDPAGRTRREILVPHTEKWFRVSCIPVDKDNLICFFENITGIKNALNDLNNSKYRYKLLLETIPDMFFVIDKDGTYIDYVPKSDTGIDLLAGDIIGSTIYEVGFSARMVKQVSKSINIVITENSIETIEYALEVKGRGTCFFEMRMVKLNSHAVMAISRDISKQKFAVKAIEEARKKAEEADMLKAAFLQNITHEVRTPLNAIVGFSNVLLTDEVTRTERLNYLQIIARNCQLLLHVFSDAIKLSKIQSGLEKVHRQYYNLNGLVTELNRQFMYEKGQLEKDHIRLIPFKGNENPKFSIVCDGNKVKDIMESLMDNAMKFTEEGEIEFGYLQPDNSSIEFFVRDSGIGIPEDEFEKIFNRFYQIDLTMKRKFGGSGIGLSLANEFVIMMGSKIKVESTPGIGSRFSFVLPFDTGSHHLRIV